MTVADLFAELEAAMKRSPEEEVVVENYTGVDLYEDDQTVVKEVAFDGNNLVIRI